MTEEAAEDDLTAPATGALPEHAVRTALLELLAGRGTVTSTEAAGLLGYSSGLCSFHLRQLARYGLVEEAPATDGRARPWRLPREKPQHGDAEEEFGELARGLEDESYRRWLAHRGEAPAEWQHDDAFSAVVYLTPAELTAVGEAVRQVLARFRGREHDPAARPAGARPVAAVARLFPLLPDDGPTTRG
ncbi:helix-turn-helix domain-containing protein [Streptomyces sp. SP17BM10]|uniref:helix-turn-helix domain-containing protein n=1 Tax=Streptomyces sp. SP17BM10 TaxID=3002530 RepID=UPI002E761C12|nr:helix-turn-helix domain-containing protein [Streptomyces sp. SP17BM10]MEE1782541.1 helix-turn-helix domain-containing protein [Streptomyces sp. SP17BM10]